MEVQLGTKRNGCEWLILRICLLLMRIIYILKVKNKNKVRRKTNKLEDVKSLATFH